MKLKVMLALALACAGAVQAEIVREVVEYTSGDATLEGVVFYDDGKPAPMPGVLVYHQWSGPTSYEEGRARQLAEDGYIAFVADIYGKGIRPESMEERGALATKYKSDRALFRERAQAALTALLKHGKADAKRIAAIGYCFGGTAVLELARSGADVKGVVSFHGGLGSPTPADAAQIKGKVLALHGADDPYVPKDEVAGFISEMTDGKVDWQLVYYGGAVHSFTDYRGGTDNSKGAAYNKLADQRSWEAMEDFLEEALGE